LSFFERPFFQSETTAGLLESRRAKSHLLRGVLEREVEEDLQRLVADADVARRSIRILFLIEARIEYARPGSR